MDPFEMLPGDVVRKSLTPAERRQRIVAARRRRRHGKGLPIGMSYEMPGPDGGRARTVVAGRRQGGYATRWEAKGPNSGEFRDVSMGMDLPASGAMLHSGMYGKPRPAKRRVPAGTRSGKAYLSAGGRQSNSTMYGRYVTGRTVSSN